MHSSNKPATKKELALAIDFDEFLNIRANRVANNLSLVFQREVLRPADLSIQEWRALLNLTHYGHCHLRALARLARLDVGHISRAIDSLEKKGLVRSFADDRDQRRKLLSVIKGGTRTVEEIWPKALELNAKIEKKIGKVRFRNFKLVLKDINEFTNELLGSTDDVRNFE